MFACLCMGRCIRACAFECVSVGVRNELPMSFLWSQLPFKKTSISQKKGMRPQEDILRAVDG